MAGLLLLLFILPVQNWLLYLRPADKALTAIYNRLYQRGYVWGITADATRTPDEFAAVLSTRLEQFAKDKKLAPLITTDAQRPKLADWDI